MGERESIISRRMKEKVVTKERRNEGRKGKKKKRREYGKYEKDIK